jgi:hypothetical protein
MTTAGTPALSVIVLVPDRFGTVAEVVRHLAAQDRRGEIEIVFVTPVDLDVPPDAMTSFQRWQTVRVPDWRSTARARAAGVAAAGSLLVAFVEDHCFPTPGWAHALIEAHRDDWAAVGPVILNANPSFTISWANLLIEYGPWLHPCEGGAAAHVPGHNSAYKRERLVAYGDRLPALLEAESVLHWDLGRQGFRVAIEPRARSRHKNFARFWPSLRLRFQSGRLFAGSRALSWPASRRAAFAAGSPVLPFLRTWRLRASLRQHASRGRPLLVPLLFVLLVVDAIGEMAGYISGPGAAIAAMNDLEFHRDRFTGPRTAVLS